MRMMMQFAKGYGDKRVFFMPQPMWQLYQRSAQPDTIKAPNTREMLGQSSETVIVLGVVDCWVHRL